MKRKLILLSTLFFILSNHCLAQQIRRPVVSGSFYPDSPKILAQTVKQFLDWATAEAGVEKSEQDKDILALISPHAGYDYSGSVAAYGYRLIKGAPIQTVILIGSSHFVNFDGVSVYAQGAWQTPLGNVPVDTELANRLIQTHPKISFYEPAFAREHSLEVQLPFLQLALDNFAIVPILMGQLSYADCQMLSQALLQATQDRAGVLIVASTDMSHEHSSAEARTIDELTIKELNRLDAQSLYYRLSLGESELCGGGAVLTTLLYAQGKGSNKNEIEILKYANSGDVTGDKNRVVGYVSAAIYAGGGKMVEAKANENKDGLNEAQKKRLLEISRKTLDEYVRGGKRIDFTENDPLLLSKMGAFVTLHKQGRLRGCIGNIIGQQALYLTVRDMTIEAAMNDPRFPAVSADELDQIDIEISVLSEPQEVKNTDEIKMGRHGVIVKKGFASGVFLPQVADETGWGREEFLANLCAHKAGLSPTAWKDKDTKLYSFTAQIVAEKDNR